MFYAFKVFESYSFIFWVPPICLTYTKFSDLNFLFKPIIALEFVQLELWLVKKALSTQM